MEARPTGRGGSSTVGTRENLDRSNRSSSPSWSVNDLSTDGGLGGNVRGDWK